MAKIYDFLQVVANFKYGFAKLKSCFKNNSERGSFSVGSIAYVNLLIRIVRTLTNKSKEINFSK
jgi:hypothetical protein